MVEADRDEAAADGDAADRQLRDRLREWRRRRAEVYVPLVHRPGEEAQGAFFEVTASGSLTPASRASPRARA